MERTTMIDWHNFFGIGPDSVVTVQLSWDSDNTSNWGGSGDVFDKI
jgi:hypothetical protein